MEILWLYVVYTFISLFLYPIELYLLLKGHTKCNCDKDGYACLHPAILYKLCQVKCVLVDSQMKQNPVSAHLINLILNLHKLGQNSGKEQPNNSVTVDT